MREDPLSIFRKPLVDTGRHFGAECDHPLTARDFKHLSMWLRQREKEQGASVKNGSPLGQGQVVMRLTPQPVAFRFFWRVAD